MHAVIFALWELSIMESELDAILVVLLPKCNWSISNGIFLCKIRFCMCVMINSEI